MISLNPNEKAEWLKTLRRAVAIVEALPAVTPCAQCDHFDAASGHCGRWEAAVPTDAQPVGCDQWVEDIPF